jgi:enterochelin esterase-like enzyme
MRKTILSVILLLLCSAMSAQSKGRVEYLKMPCTLLQGITQRDYTLYLPPGYDAHDAEKYPVLYLLHGGGCEDTQWVTDGRLPQIADSLINGGKVPKMIIVCPEANKNKMIWFNDPDWAYEDFFFKEFIPYIEQHYRALTDKWHRSVAGFSMGGGGSVVYGVHHPELFNMVYAMSSYLRRQPLEFLKNDPLGEWRQTVVERNNPIKYVAACPQVEVDKMNTVRWFIDCGDDDFTLEGNMDLVKVFRSRGIHHQFRVKDGNHNWDYWRPALVEAIKNAFITTNVERKNIK